MCKPSDPGLLVLSHPSGTTPATEESLTTMALLNELASLPHAMTKPHILSTISAGHVACTVTDAPVASRPAASPSPPDDPNPNPTPDTPLSDDQASEPPPNDSLTVDQMLEQHVGQCGRGQLIMLFYLSLSFIPQGLMMLLMIFTTASPIEQGKWTCSSADDTDCLKVWSSDPVDTSAFCKLTTDQYHWTARGDSVASQFGLTCGKAWQVTIVNSCYFLGLAVGGTIFGALSDRYGRRTALYAGTAFAAATTALTTVAGDGAYWLYAIFRVMNAVAAQGMFTAAVVLSTEQVGADYRGRVGIACQALCVLGEALLALLAFFIHGWKELSWACAAITALYILSALGVSESPRWYASRGKLDKAMAVLHLVAAKNRHAIPANVTLRCDSAETAEPAKPAAQGQEAALVLKSGSKAPGVDAGTGEETERADGGDIEYFPLLLAAYPGAGRSDELGAPVATPPTTASAVEAAEAGDLKATTIVTTPSVACQAAELADSSAAPDLPAKPFYAVCGRAKSAQHEIIPMLGAEVPSALPLTVMRALRHRALLSCFSTLSFALSALVMSFYGASFGLDGFAGNPYLNFFYLSLAELPSSIVAGLLIDRIGRVPLMLLGLAISGVACILCGMVHSAATIVFAMLGKFGSAAAWAALAVYSSEVFPTSVRSLLCGSVNIFGRLGGFITPFLFQWARSAGSFGAVRQMPFWVMGGAALVAAVLCCSLPETMQVHQPDSLQEFEQLVAAGNCISRRLRRRKGQREHHSWTLLHKPASDVPHPACSA